MKTKTNAKARNSENIKDSVKAWIELKYTSDKKKRLSGAVVGEANWEYWFVHGKVKDMNELDYIRNEGVKIVPFKDILNELMLIGLHPLVQQYCMGK